MVLCRACSSASVRAVVCWCVCGVCLLACLCACVGLACISGLFRCLCLCCCVCVCACVQSFILISFEIALHQNRPQKTPTQTHTNTPANTKLNLTATWIRRGAGTSKRMPNDTKMDTTLARHMSTMGDGCQKGGNQKPHPHTKREMAFSREHKLPQHTKTDATPIPQHQNENKLMSTSSDPSSSFALSSPKRQVGGAEPQHRPLFISMLFHWFKAVYEYAPSY